MREMNFDQIWLDEIDTSETESYKLLKELKKMNRFYGLYFVKDVAWVALLDSEDNLIGITSSYALDGLRGLTGVQTITHDFIDTENGYYILPIHKEVGRKLQYELRKKRPLKLNTSKLVFDRGIAITENLFEPITNILA